MKKFFGMEGNSYPLYPWCHQTAHHSGKIECQEAQNVYVQFRVGDDEMLGIRYFNVCQTGKLI